MSEAILQVTNLVKKIKGKTILDHISFEVGQGDCLALIGPNGAGKTTLMSCILGDKKASSGQVFIKGKKGKAQDQIAVLLQENTIPSQLRVKELIAFFQDISENGLSKEEIQALLHFKDDQYQQFADKLSGGQKRLLAFVLCLIGKPDILFLDEPTAGLDPKERAYFRNIIAEMSKDKIIIISTHIVSDIEYISDQVLIMKKGKFILQGPADELLKEVKNEVWSCRVPNNQWSNFERTHCIANSHVMKEVIEARVISTSSPIEGAIIVEPTLEDLYLKLFSDELQEG